MLDNAVNGYVRHQTAVLLNDWHHAEQLKPYSEQLKAYNEQLKATIYKATIYNQNVSEDNKQLLL